MCSMVAIIYTIVLYTLNLPRELVINVLTAHTDTHTHKCNYVR